MDVPPGGMGRPSLSFNGGGSPPINPGPLPGMGGASGAPEFRPPGMPPAPLPVPGMGNAGGATTPGSPPFQPPPQMTPNPGPVPQPAPTSSGVGGGLGKSPSGGILGPQGSGPGIGNAGGVAPPFQPPQMPAGLPDMRSGGAPVSGVTSGASPAASAQGNMMKRARVKPAPQSSITPKPNA